MVFLFAFYAHFCYSLLINLFGRLDMATTKKRLTITLSDSVYENLAVVAKEMGLSKSALITVALENYKKGQK